MPSLGAGSFMSGFNRGLFPGLSRGAEHLAQGWGAQDDFARRTALAAERVRQQQEAARQKQIHDINMASDERGFKRNLEGFRADRAMDRTKASVEGSKEVAGIHAKASMSNTSRRIGESKRKDFQASLQQRMDMARAAIEAEKARGPVTPETIEAIKKEYFSDLSPAEKALIKSGDLAPVAKPRTGPRSVEDQLILDRERAKNINDREAGKAGIKLMGSPSLQYTNPGLHRQAMDAAQRLLGGGQLTPEDIQAGGAAFEAANGRKPTTLGELKQFLGGQ